MTKVRHFYYPSSDKLTQIHAMEWKPEGEPRAVVQLIHGMQEFIDRYDDFAHFLCENGFLVVGNDHLGHGKSIVSEEKFGYFAEKNANRCVLTDLRALHRSVEDKYPALPYFILGHSMGSFLARQYICLYGEYLDGAVISGTAWHPAAETLAGKLLCRVLASRKGWYYRSAFMTNLAMGSYNKKLAPVRTKHDWLTRDESIVDAYRKDRRTQFMFTLNGFYMLFDSLDYLTRKENLKRMPKDLPVLFIAGEMDPVGAYGSGVKKTVACFRNSGMKNVQCRLYPNDRHEVLNELNRQEVYQDVLHFLEKNLGTES